MPKFKKGDRVQEYNIDPPMRGTIKRLDEYRTWTYKEEIYEILFDGEGTTVGRYGRLLAPILDLPIKDVWKGLINV